MYLDFSYKVWATDKHLFCQMSQRANYYEEELDDADDLADVGLNLAIGNYGQGGLYEDGSESLA